MEGVWVCVPADVHRAAAPLIACITRMDSQTEPASTPSPQRWEPPSCYLNTWSLCWVCVCFSDQQQLWFSGCLLFRVCKELRRCGLWCAEGDSWGVCGEWGASSHLQGWSIIIHQTSDFCLPAEPDHTDGRSGLQSHPARGKRVVLVRLLRSVSTVPNVVLSEQTSGPNWTIRAAERCSGWKTMCLCTREGRFHNPCLGQGLVQCVWAGTRAFLLNEPSNQRCGTCLIILKRLSLV